jgi:hypothetical protein
MRKTIPEQGTLHIVDVRDGPASLFQKKGFNRLAGAAALGFPPIPKLVPSESTDFTPRDEQILHLLLLLLLNQTQDQPVEILGRFFRRKQKDGQNANLRACFSGRLCVGVGHRIGQCEGLERVHLYNIAGFTQGSVIDVVDHEQIYAAWSIVLVQP